MSDVDLRDLGGRARRLFAAAVLGALGAITIAVRIPGHDHFADHWRSCFGGGDSADPAIVIAGAIMLTLGLYTVFQAIARHQRVIPLPRAVVFRR